jgi:hypothetical protein
MVLYPESIDDRGAETSVSSEGPAWFMMSNWEGEEEIG